MGARPLSNGCWMPDFSSEETLMSSQTTRRAVLRSAITASLVFGAHSSCAQSTEPAFGYPIRRGDDVLPGDGILIRHGYATENVWCNLFTWARTEQVTGLPIRVTSVDTPATAMSE